MKLFLAFALLIGATQQTANSVAYTKPQKEAIVKALKQYLAGQELKGVRRFVIDVSGPRDGDFLKYDTGRISSVIELELRRSGIDAVDAKVETPKPNDVTLLFKCSSMEIKSRGGDRLGYSGHVELEANMIGFSEELTTAGNLVLSRTTSLIGGSDEKDSNVYDAAEILAKRICLAWLKANPK